MIRLPRPREKRQADRAIALINIVFLMLIFFLIAGTVAPPVDREVTLISTAEADNAAPPDALFVTADGHLRAHGNEVTVSAFLAELPRDDGHYLPLKIAPDRDLPAATLIDLVGELRAAGADDIRIVTERGGT